MKPRDIDPKFASLTEILEESILKRIKDGNTYRIACIINRVPDEISKAWRHKGLDGEEPYCSFMKRCLAAEGEAVAERVKVIRDRSETDWRPAAWWLERRCPQEYGKFRSDGFMPANTDQLIDVSSLTDEELDRIVETSKKTRAAG